MNQLTTQKLFAQDNVQKRFEEILGKKSQGFITSVLQVVNGNNLLKKADPQTVMTAAATAAVLELPINQNLGYAWIVPYRGKAQFQIGWKGFVQLAQRSGQYKSINVVEVYEGQFNSFDKLSEELDCDFSKPSEGEIVGFAGRFELVNGFTKTTYWTIEDIKSHASKYSQTYGKKSSNGKLIHSPWNDKDQFPEMAKKTVVKNMLSKWGIMSIEMQNADLSDQSVQSDKDIYSYPDNEVEEVESSEFDEVLELLKTKDTQEEVDLLWKDLVDQKGEEEASNYVHDFMDRTSQIKEEE